MASDFDEWYKKRQDSYQRLGLGSRRSGLFGLQKDERDKLTKCIETAQCSSGYACINGQCTRINNQPGSGTNNSFGIVRSGCPENEGDCNSGSNSCSQGPTCGRGSGRVDCCGGRKTYVFKPGEETRIEGECVNNKYCNSYCTSQYALFGPPNEDPTTGLTEYCAGKPICENTDCEECGLFSGICERKFGDIPCWCDEGRSCSGCKACITNPNDSNFGSCAVTDESTKRCRQCVSIESHKCCGEEIGPIKECAPPNFSGTTNDLRDKLMAKVRKLCKDKCDDCKISNWKTYCTDTTGLPDPNTLNCPEGLTCRQSGSLDIAGVQCVFVEEMDKSNCSYKPGRWEFEGTQSYHSNGTVQYRPVYANFIQGDPDNPSAPYSGNSLRNCADGGCYPVMFGPGFGEGTSFSPTGLQPAWGESLTVEALDTPGCTGDTFACGISIVTSQGQAINCNFTNACLSGTSTNCGCIDKTYYPNGFPLPPSVNAAHFGPGCTITGKWTYVG